MFIHRLRCFVVIGYCLDRPSSSLSLVEDGSSLVIMDISRSNTNSFLLSIELKEESCCADHQGLNFSFMLLISHYIEGKVLEFQRLGF